jgi:hypothetical protein
MRKLVLSFAALAAISLVVPYAATANAEETVIVHKHHRDHFLPMLHHDHSKTVIIKHHEE